MKQLIITIAAVLVVGCAKPPPPDISIHSATKNGNIKAVKQHLAAGTDVNAKEEDLLGWTPLHYTATSGNRQITKLLISKGANVNAINSNNDTPLDIAALTFGIETSKQRSNLTQTADLLRKHGGKTSKELKAEGK